MLFSVPLVVAFASSAAATPFKRDASGMTVKVTGPTAGSVDSVDQLKFTAEITNTGAEAVKVLKYGTILDSLPTRSFTVTTKDGKAVPFIGAKLNVALNNDNAFTTIEAGKTVTVTHEVASLFDFATAGPGTFSFSPISDFRVAGAEEKIDLPAKMNSLAVASDAIEVEIKNVMKREIKRAVAVCDDAQKKSFIQARHVYVSSWQFFSSYTEGKALASQAANYINSNSGDALVEDYFSTRGSTAAGESSSRTLSCTDPAGACDGNVIAYTVISTTDIYYCDIFFDEVDSEELCNGDTTPAARNIRGGTTLHELTHALANTDDITYGCNNDKALSASQQIDNADNFNCFATEVYAASC
ncbi:zincin [Marasmius fiardii PR-910]|nr:zincin [Marasmius fiardii PR-910]